MKRRHQREQKKIRRLLDRQKVVFFVQVVVLTAAVVPLAGWAWWTYRPGLPWMPPDDVCIYSVAAAYFSILLGSQLAFQWMVAQLAPTSGPAPARRRLLRKLELYFYANLIRYGGYEVVGLLCVGAYFFTHHLIYLAFTLLSLVLYLVNRPARETIADELKLRRHEARLLFEA